MGRFVETCRRRGLNVNAGKSKVMVLGGEKVLECEVCVGGIRLEHVSEFKYLGCVLGELGADEAECSRKVVSGRRVAGSIRSLVNAKVLDESLLAPVSVKISWKEKERSRMRAVKMDNLRGIIGIKRVDKFPNARVK